MKKLIFKMLILSPILAFSQKSSIGFSGGYIPDGFGGLVEYNKNLKNKSIINTSIFYGYAVDNQNDIDITYNDITLNVGYYYKAITPERGRTSAALGLGGIIGYEIINNGDNRLDTGGIISDEDQIIYGAYVGGTFDYFLSNYYSISFFANQFYHVNSDIGNFTFFVGLGIKYFIF